MARRLLLRLGLAGALVALFLPTIQFLGVGVGWQALLVSASLLVEFITHPSWPSDRGVFLTSWQWLFVALLWLPALTFFAAVKHLFYRVVTASTLLRISGLLAVLYTTATPLLITCKGLLIGFWVWLLSLAAVTVALLIPARPESTAQQRAAADSLRSPLSLISLDARTLEVPIVFEDIAESRSRSGLRGFAHRHFGKIFDADQAKDEIKLYSIVFFVLGGLALVLGFVGLASGEKHQSTELSPAAVLVTGILVLVPAILVRVFRSRVGAVLLFGLEVFNALSLHLLSILWAAFAWRLVQACFAFHRFSRTPQPLPAEAAAPSVPAVPASPPPTGGAGV